MGPLGAIMFCVIQQKKGTLGTTMFQHEACSKILLAERDQLFKITIQHYCYQKNSFNNLQG